jgi:uncharacterized cupredoxin-like copper-binding protein
MNPDQPSSGRRRLQSLVVCSAAAVLLGTACGSSQGPESTAVPGDAPHLTISMFEYGFGPSSVSLSSGSTVLLRFRNDGDLVHEWAVLSGRIETEVDFSRDDVLAEIRLEPGAVDTIALAAPDAGTYQIICPISGHFTQGMEGSLRVTP